MKRDLAGSNVQNVTCSDLLTVNDEGGDQKTERMCVGKVVYISNISAFSSVR